MSSCPRCGTQLAASDTLCPFCSLPVDGDTDRTRMAPGPSGPQGWPPQDGPPPGPPPGPPYGQQTPPYGQQGWGAQQPAAGQPYPPQGYGPPAYGPGPGYGGGPAYGGGAGQPGGSWPSGPGGPGGSGGRKGPGPVVLAAIAVVVLLVVGLGAWGLTAALSGDDSDTAQEGSDPATSEPTSTDTPSESAEPTPTPTPSPTPSESASSGGGGGGGGGGDSSTTFDLSDGEVTIPLTVTSPGRLDVTADPDEDDITLRVTDPDGGEVCDVDASFTEEECSFEAETTGEYSIVIGVYGGGTGGTGEVRID